MSLILFASFVIGSLMRIPIEIAIGIACTFAFLYLGFDTLYIIPNQILDGLQSPTLLAIPFYILAGNLMNVGGLTDRIFNFASALVGHFRAGLAHVNVLASMIFAGISGAALADVAGLGMIQVKAMRERGYSAEFAAALSVASATIGPLIPPSISLIIYSFLSGTSIARLFLAGLVPGVMIGISLMIYNFVVAKKHDFPREERKPLPELVRSSKDGLAALIAPAIIIGSMVYGFATATEAGVLACVYTLLLGLAYRELTWKKFWNAIIDSVAITVTIMLIIGFSHVMGWLLAIEQMPQVLAETFLNYADSKFMFLVIITILLLVVGCLVEGVPAKLILVPILLPVVDQFGVDRVHFGIILTLNLLLGIATPPMGMGLYIISRVSGVPFEKVAVAVLPVLVPLFIVLLMVTFVPGFSLWLPNMIMGPE
ncbi:TRAP transporter large permease [Ruegeria sp. Ofav3-42]|uniref:TRAP transporter large permease n=1 Tax=Ruegeria sp. Ofav3-42 TaxID=2917759 RepID=UPI001EF5229A|nr:TRAP transporter large permease [Ruegeria sp. Ofav3-42]MCG7522793.1 TRAP transporter large permease [Ruegeria sp. Ofav3-42]